MTIASFEDLFEDQIADLISAENQLIKALPKMAQAAASSELRQVFEEHLEQTRGHADRLKKICEELDLEPETKTCRAMQGLIEEGQEYLQSDTPAEVRDAALIAAAQRVEHYEISAYGTARSFAQELGYDSVVGLLEDTLEEESEANEKLNEIAENGVNQQALAANM